MNAVLTQPNNTKPLKTEVQAPQEFQRLLAPVTAPLAHRTTSSLPFPASSSQSATQEQRTAAVSPFSISYKDVPEEQKPFAWALKRFFDIFFTLLGLLIIGLPLLLVALAIVIDSPGPVLFKQKRLGQHGGLFYMYKFRSMYQDAEARLAEVLENNQTNQAMFKMENDPRVTRLGRFIRKYSIDEFPQLLNVLKGDMSLVGPRPPILRELEAYEPWHYVRFSTLPGLTGAWQVSGRSSIQSFDDVVRLDENYIKGWSLWQDLSILLKTVPVVIFGRGSSPMA
jgi:lipopolysaccharide/colanic/teichoic acid biosynthesis glycosyltransferase